MLAIKTLSGFLSFVPSELQYFLNHQIFSIYSSHVHIKAGQGATFAVLCVQWLLGHLTAIGAALAIIACGSSWIQCFSSGVFSPPLPPLVSMLWWFSTDYQCDSCLGGGWYRVAMVTSLHLQLHSVIPPTQHLPPSLVLGKRLMTVWHFNCTVN